MKRIAFLLFVVPISAVSYAAVNSAPDIATPSQSIGSPVALSADVELATAMDPVVDQTRATVVSQKTSADGGAAPAKTMSLAASGAGWLLMAGFLGLAAFNSRKRPMRLLRAQSNQER